MDENEYAYYVSKVTGGEWPVPAPMVADQNDWLCRSTLGRTLFFKKEYEDAMTVLATVKDVQPNMDDAPESGMSEPEHKALCLRDLGEIIFQLTKAPGVALRYIDQAYELALAYKHPFRSPGRGELWLRHLQLRALNGQTEEAEKEARDRIASEAVASTAPEPDDGMTFVNPYIYYSYQFLAERAAASENYSAAAEFMKDGFKSRPLSIAGKRDVLNAEQIQDDRKRYEAYMQCAKHMYLPWEKLPPAVIRRNR